MFKVLLFSIIMVIGIFFNSCKHYSKIQNNPQTLINSEQNNTFFSDDTIKNTLFINDKDSINFIVNDTISSYNDSIIISEHDYQKWYDFSYEDTLTSPDSVLVADTIPTKEKKKSGMSFDYPISYKCKEKGRLDFVNKRAYLYGEVIVKYEDITLTADFMEMDFENNEVYAYGLTDSLGNVTGKPVFQEGGEEFEADSIRYNFKTKKGIVINVTTEFDGSFLHGGKTKMHENRHVHMVGGKFTTCDLDHPHFYFNITKAKVIPNDKIVSGPAFLVIEDVPTFLGIPFGFFPNSKGGASGVIIPAPGEESRGIFLRDGGYYWAINDRFDLTLLGSFFSKGSWILGTKFNYKVRYKFEGYLNFNYNKNIIGFRGLPDTQVTQLFDFKWKFNQDAKSNPNSTFSADVNLSSTKYNKNNSMNHNDFMSANQQSSISYSYNLPNTPFRMTAAFRHTQNNNTGRVDFTLPDVSIFMDRIYPLKRKVAVGETKWYEKIYLSYTMNAKNEMQTYDTAFFDIKSQNIKNGINHTIPIATSLKFLKYTTITPSFRYNERWYFKSMEKIWESFGDTVDNKIGKIDTLYHSGFNRVWNYSASIDWKTQIYGMYQFKRSKKIKALRHVVDPSISLSFSPNFSKPKYKYYGENYQIVYNNQTAQYDTVSSVYSYYDGFVYGVPGRGGSGSVRFSLGNNLEMKVRNPNDTASGDKKIKILESLSFDIGYDIFRDSLNWDPLSITGRTRVKVLDISFRATLDPYAIKENPYGIYQKVNEFMFKSSSGKIARLTQAYITLGFSLNSKSDKKQSSTDQYRTIYGYPENYVDFNVPWNLRVNYTFNYDKPTTESRITQTLNLSGDFSLTEKWKISFSTGYDIDRKEVSPTSISVHRDLHCWEAKLDLRPFGSYRSYMFQINVKSSVLQDLKLTKNKSVYDDF